MRTGRRRVHGKSSETVFKYLERKCITGKKKKEEKKPEGHKRSDALLLIVS